jgi:exodeoxyribonuclease V alpha subunit
LLGWLPSSRSRFRHDASNPLPHDVVIVDEMSMVSLTMMSRLLEAVRPSARLVLVGDPDQLSSVEAGAVLADIARAPGVPEADLGRQLVELRLITRGEAPPVHGVVQLTHTWRFGGSINELAKAIRAADPDAAIAVLRAGANDVQFREVDLESDPTAPSSGLLADMAAQVRRAGVDMLEAARTETFLVRWLLWTGIVAVRASARTVRRAALGFRGRARWPSPFPVTARRVMVRRRPPLLPRMTMRCRYTTAIRA